MACVNAPLATPSVVPASAPSTLPSAPSTMSSETSSNTPLTPVAVVVGFGYVVKSMDVYRLCLQYEESEDTDIIEDLAELAGHTTDTPHSHPHHSHPHHSHPHHSHPHHSHPHHSHPHHSHPHHSHPHKPVHVNMDELNSLLDDKTVKCVTPQGYRIKRGQAGSILLAEDADSSSDEEDTVHDIPDIGDDYELGVSVRTCSSDSAGDADDNNGKDDNTDEDGEDVDIGVDINKLLGQHGLTAFTNDVDDTVFVTFTHKHALLVGLSGCQIIDSNLEPEQHQVRSLVNLMQPLIGSVSPVLVAYMYNRRC